MNEKQAQCLLMYLGYYAGGIDGIWGKMSKAAAKAFQTDYGLKASGDLTEETKKSLKHAVAYGMPEPDTTSDVWDEIQYFKPEEFRCKCGGKYCDGFPAEPERKLLKLADRVREHFGAPVTVSSGLRCEIHNRNEGGVENSRHLKGKAMDFRVAGLMAEDVLEYVKAQPEVRYTYDINGTYVHMDVE